jgi:hypothetical protein
MMTLATKKQINYLNILIKAEKENIGSHTYRHFIRPILSKWQRNRMGFNQLDRKVPREKQQRRDIIDECNRNHDWDGFNQALNEMLDKIDPATLTVRDASKLINELKRDKFSLRMTKI